MEQIIRIHPRSVWQGWDVSMSSDNVSYVVDVYIARVIVAIVEVVGVVNATNA